MALACRVCRVPLHAERGCAVCDPLRRQLVSVDEDEDEKPDLGDVAAETVALLRRQIRFVKAVLDNDAGNLAAFGLLNKAANTVAKVLEASRKLQADAEGVIRNMSFAARAKLFVGWYAELPPPYRAQLREQLDRFEVEAAKPLHELKAGDGE